MVALVDGSEWERESDSPIPPTVASYLNFRSAGATVFFFSSCAGVEVVDYSVLSDAFTTRQAPTVFRPSLGLPSVTCVRSP